MIGFMAGNVPCEPLFAMNWLFALDPAQVIGFVVFIVVGILSAIAQYFAKQKEEAARQQRLEEQAKRRAAMAELAKQQEGQPPVQGQAQRPQQPFGQSAARRKPVVAAPVDEDVAAEIRDFLERAATNRPGQATRPGQAAPARPATARPVAKSVPPVASPGSSSPRTPLSDRPAHRTAVEQRPVPTTHPSMRPLEAKIVTERQVEAVQAKKLAEARQRQAAATQAKQAGEQPGGSKFDHKLGSLPKQAAPVRAASPTPLTPEIMANDIAVLLASTDNIRQAIVINEILTRPVHRWE